MHPNLNLPKDILLSKDNIRIALDHNAFSSMMTHLSNDETLCFSSRQSAMDKLISDSELSTLCYHYIQFNESGNMLLVAGAQYVDKVNSCVEGHLDLVTGESSFIYPPCYYTVN